MTRCKAAHPWQRYALLLCNGGWGCGRARRQSCAGCRLGLTVSPGSKLLGRRRLQLLIRILPVYLHAARNYAHMTNFTHFTTQRLQPSSCPCRCTGSIRSTTSNCPDWNISRLPYRVDLPALYACQRVSRCCQWQNRCASSHAASLGHCQHELAP